MLINKSKIVQASQGFKAVFFEELAAKEDEIVSKLAARVSTSNTSETYGWLEKLSGMKEFVGEARIGNVGANSYTIQNKEWEDTVSVSARDIANDSLGKYKKLFQAMATGARLHDGEVIADFLCNGFSRACYDGANFFSDVHKYQNGLTYSNVLTKKLSVENFRNARSVLRTMRKPSGKSMGLGKDIVLLVGAANESLAREILTAERTANGSTNIDKGTARPVVWSEIDVINPNAWFVCDLGQVIQPFIIQQEQPVEFRHCDDPNDSYVIQNNEFLYQAYKVAGYGYAFPQLMVGSDGSTAA